MFKTYTIKTTLGVIGDMATEWWTGKDWEEWRLYCQGLKERGEFGKEIETSITIKHTPVLDEPNIKRNLSSFKILILSL